MNKTDIINAALQRCGAAGINLAYQGTREADIAAAAYDRCRRLVLGQYPWSFAERYAAIARNAEKPPFGYANAFRLPGDCVTVIDAHRYEVNDDGEIIPGRLFSMPKERWEVVEHDVLADSETLALRYVADDPHAEMPDFFGDVVAWRLAFEMSPYLEQAKGNPAYLLQMYERSLDDARVENDRRINPERPEDWAESRQLRRQFLSPVERW